MTFKILLTTAAGALMLTACNADRDDSAQMANNDAAMGGTNTIGADTQAPAPAAQDFVDTVAGSDMYEIESGKLAQEKATAADLKSFGGMLVTDHTRSSEMLKTAATSAQPALVVPTALPADLQTKLDALKAASAAEFDRLFVEQQTEGHQKALDTLRAYASGGDQQALREFATTAQPVVEGHLNQLIARGR